MKLFASLCLLLPLAAAAQTDTTSRQIYIVDSVMVTSDTLQGLPPDQIAMITIATGKKTIEKYGERAAEGVIFIETKPFARKRYNRLFSGLSPAYAAALRQKGSDSTFRYSINDRPLNENVENELAALEKDKIKSIEVKVDDKQVGVLIRTEE